MTVYRYVNPLPIIMIFGGVTFGLLGTVGAVATSLQGDWETAKLSAGVAAGGGAAVYGAFKVPYFI